MNDTTKEQNGKIQKQIMQRIYSNNVNNLNIVGHGSVHYLKVMRELKFGKSYVQSCLVILLPKYFISFLNKQKHAHNF